MGVMGGLLGVGGGIIAVPVLIGLLGLGDLLAKGTSLVALVPGAIASSLVHLRYGFNGIKLAATLIPASVLGVLVGSALAFQITPDLGGYLLSVVLTGIAVRLALSRTR
jgi:hypothetical protein